MTSSSHPAAPLLRALQDCVLPALEYSLHSRFVIARTQRRQLLLPPDMRAVPMKLRGRRVAVRSTHGVARSTHFYAHWPQDGIHQQRIPKMVAVVRGLAGLRAGDYILQCPLGTLLFLPANIPHLNGTISHLETLPPDVQHCTLFWITPFVNGLECRFCHSSATEHRFAAPGEKVFLPRPRLLQLFSMLAEEIEETPPDWREAEDNGRLRTPVFKSLLLALMEHIQRDIHNKQFVLQDIPPYEGKPDGSQDAPMERAAQYVRIHHARPLTLDDMARRTFMSRAQFTRKFRLHTGQSFVDFINARRLEHACELLLESDWTVVTIAITIGFDSVAHFHRFFRRKMGMTPVQYRAQVRRLRETSSEKPRKNVGKKS